MVRAPLRLTGERTALAVGDGWWVVRRYLQGREHWIVVAWMVLVVASSTRALFLLGAVASSPLTVMSADMSRRPSIAPLSLVSGRAGTRAGHESASLRRQRAAVGAGRRTRPPQVAALARAAVPPAGSLPQPSPLCPLVVLHVVSRVRSLRSLPMIRCVFSWSPCDRFSSTRLAFEAVCVPRSRSALRNRPPVGRSLYDCGQSTEGARNA